VCAPIEVKAVENLWMIGDFPVDGWTADFFFFRAIPESRPTQVVLALSRSASLDCCGPKRRIDGAPNDNAAFLRRP
jgi:hypothetical protein